MEVAFKYQGEDLNHEDTTQAYSDDVGERKT